MTTAPASATSAPVAARSPLQRLLEWPFHPIVFAATIVLAYWLDTVVHPAAAIRSLVVAGLGALVLTVFATLLLRNAARGGLVASAIIGLLYSKHLVDIAAEVFGAAPRWLAVAWVVAILCAVVLVARLLRRRIRRWPAVRASVLLNWTSLVYLLATVALGVTSGKFAYAVAEMSREPASVSDAAAGAPDIYLILLDGYPRQDALQTAFGFDNTAFIEALESRGFDVARSSRSDYIWTTQSLISMLHMTYLTQHDVFMAAIEGRAPISPTMRELVNENPSFDLAREHGYRVVAPAYPFEELSQRHADVFIDPGLVNEFELKLMVSTYLSDIVAVLAPDFASSQHRQWIEFQLETLSDLASQSAPGPRLIVGHVPAPHQPAVLGAHGEPLVVPLSRHFHADSPPERGEPVDEFAQRYRDQLTYLNGEFLEMVDSILAGSTEPPVIVLWADHGSASQHDWAALPYDADEAATLERTSTLFASMTPGAQGVFPDDITPVDIFRLLADAYLDTDLGRARGR